MTYQFSTGEELILLCAEHNITMAEAMIRAEMQSSELSREDIVDEMRKNLYVMRESIDEGITSRQLTMTGQLGGDAELLTRYAPKAIMGEHMAQVVAAALAVTEVNASMGKIVAAPTAGASGILPAVLIVCGDKKGFTDKQLIDGLFAAGAVGMIIASRASISGAEGGCQAETGTAAAMAAAALAELCGASPKIALTAAAIALKNIMGLVCDPVAGLVECPCIKRNAIGAANAVLSCDMALAGITSLIPFDEVVLAMRSVGRLMHPDLRETAKAGLAATPTALNIAKTLQNPSLDA
ncbi:MAG: L-serine ammonia-lyase, iron-sulfur-dependent, subunit alpha [Clostridia bacterium]|nr:L-serine ammonia-lyase, iron-sulfur-dependent, subunit alpha [Clostridia bacterium]